MRRSFARRCGIVLAALALPVLFIGTGATASTPARRSSRRRPSTVTAPPSSSGFNQVVIGGFKQSRRR